MANHYAEVGVDRRVVRVVVADSAEWCVEHLGGLWVQTYNPNEPGEASPRVAYAGRSHLCHFALPALFAAPPVVWDQATATVQQQDPSGDWYWTWNTTGVVCEHNGELWVNRLPTGTPNVWEPGVSGWHQLATDSDGWGRWVAPTGAHDSYWAGFVAAHDNKVWRSDYDDNVWEPGVFGWTKVNPRTLGEVF